MFITFTIVDIVLAIDLNNRLGYYQFIQTTPATPVISNNAQLAGFKARVKR